MKKMLIWASFLITLVNNLIAQDITEGLEAFYPFNGNAKDESGNGYHGSVHGATLTKDRFDNDNSAYRFNGSSSYIAIPDEIFGANIPSFTFTVWVLSEVLDNKQRVVIYKGAANGEAELFLYKDNTLSFGVKLSDRKWHEVRTNFVKGKYFFITCIYRRGDKIEIWINGELKNSLKIPNINLYKRNGFSSSIGAYNRGQIQHWKGVLDDIRIYSRALSEEEIEIIYNGSNYNVIKIESPVGGELIEGGSNFEVIWSTNSSRVHNITLRYSTDGGLTFPNLIAERISNSGMYIWNTPNELLKSCKVKIQAFNSEDNLLAEDISNENFLIGLIAKTTFAFGIDNYSFSNAEFKNYVFEPLWIVLHNSDWLERFRAFLITLSKFTSFSGSCVGMSITSTIYFVDNALIPEPNKSTYDLTFEEAESNILAYQEAYAIDCIIPSMKSYLGIPITYNSFLNYFKEMFSQNYPVEIALSSSGSTSGHAVIAIKLVDFDETKRVYIYDVNFPEEKNRYLELVLQENNSYYFSGYHMGKNFYDRFEPFDPINDPVDPSEFWSLFWNWISEILGDFVNQGKAFFSLACPADALIEDEYGRKIGVLSNETINEIPEANIIASDSIEIYELPSDLKYAVTITGKDTGTAEINLLISNDEQDAKIQTIGFRKLPLQYGSVAQFNFSQQKIDDSMRVDLDNDGLFEQIIHTSYNTAFNLEIPEAPSNLTGRIVSDNLVQLQWQDNTDSEFGFMLEIKETTGAEYELLAILEANVTTYLDENEKTGTLYFYRVKAITPGSESDYSNEFMIDFSTGIPQGNQLDIDKFQLHQNFPNPFNPETSISFQLPHPEKVEIVIFNQVGQVIRRLTEGEMQPGRHQVVWDARNDSGKQVSSGIYLCQMIAGSYRETMKMLLLK